MKKILLLAAVCCMALACEKPQEEPAIVEVTFDYQFSSGVMTKGGAEVYNSFYESHIKNKELTPKSYSLTIKTQDKKNVVAELKGDWGSGNTINLPVGTYHISGISQGSHEIATLTFDEEISLTASTTNVVLNAGYGCALVMFDADNKTKVKYWLKSGNSADLNIVDDLYYVFCEVSKIDSATSLVWYTTDNLYNNLHFSSLGLKDGHYYYFNNVTESFDIPPMTSGQE